MVDLVIHPVRWRRFAGANKKMRSILGLAKCAGGGGALRKPELPGNFAGIAVEA
jgi:hypothetical protein